MGLVFNMTLSGAVGKFTETDLGPSLTREHPLLCHSGSRTGPIWIDHRRRNRGGSAGGGFFVSKTDRSRVW